MQTSSAYIHRNKIYLYQKKILRIINKKSVDYPTSELFRQDNILNIYKMYKFKVLQNAHSYFYSSSYCSKPSYPYSTRHSSYNLTIPLFTSSAGQKSFSFQQAKLWNELPKDIRDIKNAIHFKSRLKSYLLSSWFSACLFWLRSDCYLPLGPARY